MIQLSAFTLNGLLKMIVHWPDLFHDCEGSLPMGQELTSCTGEEQQDAITHFKVVWLRQSVIGAFMLSLKSLSCGPTRSMPILLKTTLMIDSGISGAGQAYQVQCTGRKYVCVCE